MSTSINSFSATDDELVMTLNGERKTFKYDEVRAVSLAETWFSVFRRIWVNAVAVGFTAWGSMLAARDAWCLAVWSMCIAFYFAWYSYNAMSRELKLLVRTTTARMLVSFNSDEALQTMYKFVYHQWHTHSTENLND